MVTNPPVVYLPIHNPKIPNATAFCDLFYRLGLRGNGGKWLLLPGYWHTGVDMNVAGTAGDEDLGKPVYAVADGRVAFAGTGVGTSWGKLVCISHTSFGVGSRSAHLDTVLVKTGDMVKAGQLIGTIGKGYGNKWVAHLHFDIYLLGKLPNFSWWCTRFGAKTEVTNIFIDPKAFFKKFSARDPFSNSSHPLANGK